MNPSEAPMDFLFSHPWTAIACALCLLCASAPAAATDEIALLSVDAAAGSAEPHLAAGSDGTLVLSWLEPDGEATVLRFSTLGPGGWTTPRTVARGGDWFVNWADFPSVLPVSGSLWAAHWLRRRADSFYAYDVAVALSEDGGETWSAPVTPHRDGTPTEHGFVSLFPWQGGVGAVWLDGRNTYGEVDDDAHHAAGGMTLRSAVIGTGGGIHSETEIDGLVCDCCQTDVALARQGPVVVYRDRTEREIRDVFAARVVDGKWQPGRPVAEDGWRIDGCPVNGPAIAARGDDVAVGWFTMAGDEPKVRFARSGDGGRSFAEAIDVATDSPAGRVDVALLGDGRAAVMWLDGTEGSHDGALKVRILTAAGEPDGEHVIARTSVIRPAGFPQMVADGDSLVVAWTDVSGEDSRVKSARIDL